MKLKNILITGALSAMVLTSCVKDVLDKQNLQNLTADQIYNDSLLVKYSVDQIYEQNLPTWFGNTGGKIGGGNSLTEEQYGDNEFVKGTVTIETVADFGVSNVKSNNYGKIRTLNMFIRDVAAGSLDIAVKRRFTAQALFFRAYRYFDMVRLYGGVPLVLTPLEGVGQEAKDAALLPRNTTTQCFKQILADLDTAIKYLPRKWPNNADYGRISAGAAAAFKGRVLLTYASPEFNPNQLQDRWKAAYDANVQAVSILTASGYGLHPSYDNLWFSEGSSGANPEAVLVTQYNTATSDNGRKSNTYDSSTRPSYLGNSGGSNQPTWDLVKAYPMKDGKDTTKSSYDYDDRTFYKNRDPRFDKTIAYNGCNWPILGNSNYRLWTYFYYSNATSTSNKSTEPSASGTGFYLRKAINPNTSLSDLPYSGTDWIEIRYAEVLLNLAECAAEIGNLGSGQEAYTSLVAIRKRAGIEPGADNLYGLASGMSHDAMIDAIMKERQIELAFEGKRFWDLRRRKLLEKVLNGRRRTKVTIQLKSNKSGTDYIARTRDVTAATNLDDLYNNSFVITVTNLDTYNIAYQNTVYFFGLPSGALTNNPKLTQTNTWGGTFNPLE